MPYGITTLLFLFRSSGVTSFSPLNGKRERPHKCQECLLFSKLFSANSSLRLLGVLHYEQIELMWLGHKVPDWSFSSDQNKLLGELHFLTLDAKSDHVHKGSYPQSPVLSAACSVHAGLFALPNALQNRGHCFKPLRSCLSVLWPACTWALCKHHRAHNTASAHAG